MKKYRLISFKTCPWVQRAAIVLREKAVSFEFVHIDPADRPAWFSAISPHGKVPVLDIDGETALFESNAIAEYLDEMITPRLHPADPVQRAYNRAWTDYLPSFSGAIGAVTKAADDSVAERHVVELREAFAKLERALAERGDEGPWFNGTDYSLVDAAYAPFLQRWIIVERTTGLRLLDKAPHVARWAAALTDRPTTHSFPPAEFERLYLAAVTRQGGWLAQNAAQPAG